VAREFAEQFKVAPPILVDTIDNAVEKAYSAMPDRIYVIDAAGKVAYKGGPGPGGFHVWEVPPMLDRLLGVQLAAKTGLKEPGPESGGPAEGRERLAGMLKRLGVEEKDARHVEKAFDRKTEAYREVTEARAALVQAVAREKGDAAKPLAAYQEAQKKYAKAAEKIDRDLDAAVGYSKDPRLEAALTALGLLGAPPGPPLSAPAGGAKAAKRPGKE
jgi:hypothetical protein